MATQKQVTEPAAAEHATTATEPKRTTKRDPRTLVYVYDSRTGNKVDRPVPESWLDQFPHLKEQSSKKEGK